MRHRHNLKCKTLITLKNSIKTLSLFRDKEEIKQESEKVRERKNEIDEQAIHQRVKNHSHSSNALKTNS
jgi:hypothetical protein